MKQYLAIEPWRIVEKKYYPDYNEISESVFSIGNGKMGQRANFEEDFSGNTLQGNYLAGIYYPDKTRVGWWKNGYPDYFAKVLNAVNWIGLNIIVDGQLLDLATVEIQSFERILDMQQGVLKRIFTVLFPKGQIIEVKATRFYSMVYDEIGALSYQVKAVNFSGKVSITSYIDFNVRNEDANYDENFWTPLYQKIDQNIAIVSAKTLKTNFQVACGISNTFFHNNRFISIESPWTEESQKNSLTADFDLKKGDSCTIHKKSCTVSSFYYSPESFNEKIHEGLATAQKLGFEGLLEKQREYWIARWKESDIVIQDDVSAQQALRFNIFQLNQTYTGVDARLNIGPKGFTGEKYGGSTYWDTEAYCIPYYLSTAPQNVSRNLLIYRYNQLDKAIENAVKLGFKRGAALFPMVTMNGEECHNEWEITFEEIHRNGAIAYAIHDYVNYTGDRQYLIDYGLEVLIAISRFWAQRFNFSEEKQQYVMLGVTGPNEYENNVNNNWYTSYIAKWCLEYTEEIISYVQKQDPLKYQEIVNKTGFDPKNELQQWHSITTNIFFPIDDKRGVFLQQENFLDKELKPANQIPLEERPISQNWSWDRILRSCFIKQADVLQGLYMFEDHFDKQTLQRNYDFYEPMTVHESSLSPCIHAILAASIGYQDKAYELFMRTARLDLDDYNNDTNEGCHITSMAGTWMAFVKGFGGIKVTDGQLYVNPFLPKKWKAYSFTIGFRAQQLNVRVTPNEVAIEKGGNDPLTIMFKGQQVTLFEGVNTFHQPITLNQE